MSFDPVIEFLASRDFPLSLGEEMRLTYAKETKSILFPRHVFVKGELVDAGGVHRVVGPIPLGPKYRIVKGTPPDSFFGRLSNSSERDVLFIVEGETDVLALIAEGAESVISFGEKGKAHPSFFESKATSYKKIVIFYDNDRPGELMAKRLRAEILEFGVEASIHYLSKTINDLSELRLKSRHEIKHIIDRYQNDRSH